MEIVALGLAMVAILVMLGCGLWMVVNAFRESPWWGLAYLFLPFASLAYVLMHWDENSKPFLSSVAAMLVLVGCSMVAPSIGKNMAFGGSGDQIKMMKANMKVADIAANAYATDHEGRYPTTIDQLKPFYPGGDNKSQPGEPSVNPFSNKPEWPVEGSITSVSDARKGLAVLKAGTIEYSVIKDEQNNPMSYAIRGGGGSDTVIKGTGDGNLVLSNQ